MNKRELIFSERYNDASRPSRIESPRFRNVVFRKKKGKMVKKAMSTPSDTLPFKDHSATDRKGVPLDFTAPSPLPVTCSRYALYSSYTPVTLLSPKVFLPFYSFRPYSPLSTSCLALPPLGLPRLDRA